MSIKNTVKGTYHETKGSINKNIGNLTKDELMMFKGDSEKLAGHLQKKYNIRYDQAIVAANRMFREC